LRCACPIRTIAHPREAQSLRRRNLTTQSVKSL